nr:ATP-binding cassette domain-containing protein [Microbulbifer guangxiensis]
MKLERVSLCYKSGYNIFKSSKKTVLSNISMEIRRGEKIGVVGRNGAGKSSLLKLLAGIYQPDKGKIFASESVRSAFIGLQNGFVPYMSGLDNITLTGLLMGMTRSEVRRKLEQIVDYTELGENIHRPVFSYSSGMKARLAFAISAFSEPDLLLIDEAMSVGDRAFRKKSEEKIAELIKGDAAVVLVSHESHLIQSICTQAIWLDRGVVVQSGDSDSVAEVYAKSFEANPGILKKAQTLVAV